MQVFLDFWPTDVRLAVEVRHPHFFTEPHTVTLNTLLRQYNVARVMMDTRPIQIGSPQERQVHQARERKPHLPLQVALTTDFTLIRYIGHPRMEVNEPFLKEWAQQLGQWLTQGMTPYVFCHCPFEEHSPYICAELYQQVKTLVPLPALPWLHGKMEPEQARLF